MALLMGKTAYSLKLQGWNSLISAFRLIQSVFETQPVIGLQLLGTQPEVLVEATTLTVWERNARRSNLELSCCQYAKILSESTMPLEFGCTPEKLGQ